MKLTSKVLFFILLIMVTFSSCKKNEDDGIIIVPERDRVEEALVAKLEIEAFLQTHFYNYEEFQNPPAGFNFKIVFDTIAGVNANKIPLIEQVTSKTVVDRVKTDLTYTLYFLNVIQGEGDTPIFADAALLSFKGQLLNQTAFDASDAPIRLDLTQVLTGFQEAIVEFNTSTGFVENPDGTITFENYGVGAVFIPSGLGYWLSPPPGSPIPVYSQLIFTFQVYDVTKDIDHDLDGIPSFMEDLNGNSILNDDDTDADGIPNYLDTDDDGDGVLTIDEIIVNEDGTITFPDSNNNGTPDYLDATFPG
ncbi:MAG: hypothetical protein COZ75_06755 [Flavobacteriaceae bacterium CG_4_8_14_3_um_filter_34_10]|nr:hypothetical protein [Flavobacteriia bacterium]OIP50820.1 MAG: hypothetical protein AUK33_06290 [Flavobacteriaceae bacterium CG2_30_34_30]PIQ17608.1 MAG: hypothetical protein COW66_10860 [Flavobacteriaceae bacterium CG18_big_fil_WC_8_21_14_2_50_34_36]PIV49103.1 MAG: hypothetical protein COS19_10355 [Flavobacteriaceae bacterium CG02_land_8_20_14_3_00_34_13]PIX09418.1 MAG: hypothetical protein COZ75_06755 [Flavobacteriaceae bacterium CG_4_8_14_3_um_filter_34_10]PIZ08471.1 MAG: hypothetical pr